MPTNWDLYLQDQLSDPEMKELIKRELEEIYGRSLDIWSLGCSGAPYAEIGQLPRGKLMHNEITYGRYKVKLDVKVGGPVIISIEKKVAEGEWEHIKAIVIEDTFIAEGGK